MTRKRFIKLLMGLGLTRDESNYQTYYARARMIPYQVYFDILVEEIEYEKAQVREIETRTQKGPVENPHSPSELMASHCCNIGEYFELGMRLADRRKEKIDAVAKRPDPITAAIQRIVADLFQVPADLFQVPIDYL